VANKGETSEQTTAFSIFYDSVLQNFLSIGKVSEINTNRFRLTCNGIFPPNQLIAADDYDIIYSCGREFYSHKEFKGSNPSIVNASKCNRLKFEACEKREPNEEWQQKSYPQKAKLVPKGFVDLRFQELDNLGIADYFNALILAYYNKPKGQHCSTVYDLLGTDALYVGELAFSGIMRLADGCRGSLRRVVARKDNRVTVLDPTNKGDLKLAVQHMVVDVSSRTRYEWGRFGADGKTLLWAPQLRLQRSLFSALCERNGHVDLAPLPIELTNMLTPLRKENKNVD